jgi:hypothetical protein
MCGTPIVKSPELDDSTLSFNFNSQEFWLGTSRPRIEFRDDMVIIGCKKVTSRAMDELCRRWTEFRQRSSFVVQS